MFGFTWFEILVSLALLILLVGLWRLHIKVSKPWKAGLSWMKAEFDKLHAKVERSAGDPGSVAATRNAAQRPSDPPSVT